MDFLKLIWIIPLLPAAGAVTNGLLGKRLSKRSINIVACGLVGLAFVLALGAVNQLVHLPPEERHFEVELFTWIPAGMGELRSGAVAPFLIQWGFQLDPLSAVMVLVVTGIGFLIHVYSTGYMAHEGGYYRFFSYLNLFMFFMLILVLGANYVLLFVGWEGVGLCSYLLIGFYTDRLFDARTGMTCSDAGRKAFITNRVGDFAFVIGVLFLLERFATLDFSSIMTAINGHSSDWYGAGLLTVVG